MEFWKDGRVRSTSNQFLHRQPLHRVSDLTIWELWSLLKTYKCQEGLDVKLWLMLVNFSAQIVAVHPIHSSSVRMFLQQFSCSFWEQGWATRTLFSKCQGPVFWLLVAASDHRDTDTETGSHCSGISLSSCKSLSSRSYFLGTLITSSFFFFFFAIATLGSLTLDTRAFKRKCTYGENLKVITHTQGKTQAQKRLGKTLSLHFRLIFSTETAYSSKQNKSNKQKPANPGSGEEFHLHHCYIIRFKCLFFNNDKK